jgi:fido (protein-threonine AMPylation protein)
MIKITPKQQKIIHIFLQKGVVQSSAIHAAIPKEDAVSLVTVKRTLSEMASAGLLVTIGSGRSTGYGITPLGRLFSEVDAKTYSSIEPDKRYGQKNFNFDLFPSIPRSLFSADEQTILNKATEEYLLRTKDLPLAIQKKELARLVIELAWKSSTMEGNTYTLLDTEKLILENKEAAGHDKKEALMILNHKAAFDYIRQHSSQFQTITRKNLEEIHALLVKGLSVGFGLRTKPVGVTGSKYLPLDNIHQLTEAVNNLAEASSRLSSPYAKALIALLGIGYIQPFEDGNKRTGRLMANALLMSHNLAPLSYRSVDENEYREAMLVFYELNSLVPLKKIFIGQYDFAARNYAVAP